MKNSNYTLLFNMEKQNTLTQMGFFGTCDDSVDASQESDFLAFDTVGFKFYWSIERREDENRKMLSMTTAKTTCCCVLILLQAKMFDNAYMK